MGFISDSSDSEAETAITSPIPDEEIPILQSANGSSSRSAHRKHTHFSPHTPTSRSDIKIPRTRKRTHTTTESAEIWDELEDSPTSPSYSTYRRRSSALSTPTPFRTARTTQPSPQVRDGEGEEEELPSEHTSLLRTGTGRSYRDRRRRRSVPLSLRTGNERRRSVGQDALGGWWKMRWWNGSRSRKDRDSDGGEGGRPTSA